MHTAIIIAAFAITALAVPLPTAENPLSATSYAAPAAASFIEKYNGIVVDPQIVGEQSSDIVKDSGLDKRQFEKSHSREAELQYSEDAKPVVEEAVVEVGKRQYPENRRREAAPQFRRYHPRDVEEVEAEDKLAKRQFRRYHPRDVEEVDAEDKLAKRQFRQYHPRDLENVEAEDKLAKRQFRQYHPRDVEEVEAGDKLVKRQFRRYHPRNVEEMGERDNHLSHGNSGYGSGKIARSIYDGVGAVVEALKTRGFNSTNAIPAREAI